MKNLLQWLYRSNPGRIIATILLFAVFSSYLPLWGHRFFYTISLFIKDLLMFVLPVMVMIFISSSLTTFKSKAPLLILSLMIFEFFSNASSVMVAYGVGNFALDQLQPVLGAQTTHGLDPYFHIGFLRPRFWSGDKGMFVGVCLGLLTVFLPHAPWSESLIRLREAINSFFSRRISKLAPLFLLGFMSNMYVSGFGDLTNPQYVASFAIAIISLLCYIVFLYLLAANFQVATAFSFMKNAFPSLLMSLSTMCSITTMPYTIACAEKNLKNPNMAKMIIPATTNIQQIGDCLLNAFFCIIMLKTFGKPIPNLSDWLIFVGVFATARFATAGVLGGAIFIMLPIYEKYLGFTSEMSVILLALNVLFDPIVTTGNVYANGALCIVFERFWGRIDRQFTKISKVFQTGS